LLIGDEQRRIGLGGQQQGRCLSLDSRGKGVISVPKV
jgi:hypothetical protein